MNDRVIAPTTDIKRLLIAVGICVSLPFAVALAIAWPLFAYAEAPFGDTEHGAPMGDGMFPRHASPFMAGRPAVGSMPPLAGSMPDAGPMPPFLLGLTLTEAQQDKIFLIGHAAAPLLREQDKLVRKSAERIRELAASGEYDEVKLKAYADAGARAMAEIMVMRARSTHQIFALLSPEQRTQADAMKAKFEARREIPAGIRLRNEELKPVFDHSSMLETK